MTNAERLDLLLLARVALKTAVIFTEQAMGTAAALEIMKAPVLNAPGLLTMKINEMSDGTEQK